MIHLRTLVESDEDSFLRGLADWQGEETSWYSFLWDGSRTYSQMLKKLEADAKGIDLEPGRVAHTMLYGFLGSEIIGRVSVRHELNEYLLSRGGHIGYAVAPKYRRRGYARQMVRQALEYCVRIGLRKVLITCSTQNTASIKIIEGCGAQIENTVFDEPEQEWINRYWLTLPTGSTSLTGAGRKGLD